MPFTTIVAGVDFSDNAREALRAALGLAERQGGRLVVVNAIDMLLVEAAAVAYDDGRLKAETETALNLFVAAECRDRFAGVEWKVDVRVGRPPCELLAAAEAHHADLIVVGTHGLGTVRKLFFGSTAERVLRGTKVPVLAVPPDEGRLGPVTFTRMLVAIDLDETAAPLAAAGAKIAKGLGLPLTLMHVVRPLQVGWRWAEGRDGCQRVQQARRDVDTIAKGLPVPVDVAVMSGEPEEQIATAAAQEPGALIVVGLGPEELFHRPGTTAYRILCLSTAPVLAMPMKLRT